MKVRLLDVNLLIALAWPVHVHHAAARKWFERTGQKGWATCPFTEAAFVRISSNPAIIRDAVRPEQALDVLKEMAARKNHHFWPADLSLTDPSFTFSTTLSGHRQVTDAVLVALARKHGGGVATLDRGMAIFGKDAIELVTY